MAPRMLATSDPPEPWEGVLIATLAGASTIIGGLSLFLVKRFKPIPFSITLGLAGGVMTYVTMVEMIPETIRSCGLGLIELEQGKEDPRDDKLLEAYGWLLGTSCVFLGWALGWFISWSLDTCLERCNLVGEVNFDADGNLVQDVSKAEEDPKPPVTSHHTVEVRTEPTTDGEGDSRDLTSSSLEVDNQEARSEESNSVSGSPASAERRSASKEEPVRENQCGLDLVQSSDLSAFFDESGRWDGERALQSLLEHEGGFSRFLLGLKGSVDEAEYASIRLVGSAFRRDQSKFLRIGLFTAIALGIHNMPEGMATYTSYMEDKNFGFSMALAIAVHNIPEGIAVAVPCYFGTGSWVKALGLCTISAIAEPIGALIAMGIKSMNDSHLTDGIMFGFISGFMLRVAISELFFTGFKYDPTNVVMVKAMLVGMGIMAFSLVILEFTSLNL